MSNLQWFVHYARKVRGLLLLSTVLFILEGVSGVALIGIQKYIIDDAILGEKYHLLVPLLISLAVLALVFNLLHLYAARFRSKAHFSTQRVLVEKVFRFLHVIPIQHFRKERTGKYVQNLTGDVGQVSNAITQTIPQGALQVTQTVLLCVIIGMASPVILISIVLISSIYIVLGRYFSPRVKKAAKAKTEQKTNLVVHMEEGISSSREVIAFYRQKWERSKFHQLFDQYFSKTLQENKLKNQQILLSDPLRWSVLLVVFGYGGYLVIQENMMIGTFIVVYQFSSQLLGAFQGLFNFVMGISNNMSAVERIREVLEGDTIHEGNQTIAGKVQKLTFDQVSFQYDDGPSAVLENMSINIPIGKKIAFVGTSGGGKSTVAQLLVRFYDPTAGQIMVNDEPLTEVDRIQWLERLNIVFQEPYMYPDTIHNNLRLGRDIADHVVAEICQKMLIHEFILSLPGGYETEVGERGIKLSGGQRQRIALARALLSEPEILILDESTSALDLETERQVQQNLDELRQGQTTIIIAHRLSTVINADLICVFDQGKVVEQGTHEELMVQGEVYPRLARVMGEQNVQDFANGGNIS